MNDNNCKKSIMKILGIQQLISQYQNHCDKMAGKKKKNNQNNQVRNRYSSLLDIDSKKLINNSAINIYTKPSITDNLSNKNCTNKSFDPSHKQNTIHSEINNNKINKIDSKLKPNSLKPNIMSPLINFNKKISISNCRDQQKSKQVSIDDKQHNHRSINANSQANIKQNTKQGSKYSSYLSLKARNTQKLNDYTKLDIDFDNPTLAGINKKIKEFQMKANKKEQSISIFKKSSKSKQNDQEVKNHHVKTVRISETVNVECQNSNKNQQFVSIDTNYYGYSFKNKIPFPTNKNDPKRQFQKQINSTLDKSSNQKQSFQQTDNSKIKQISKSTSKIQPSTGRKTFNTLNTQKEDRYNSANILKKKKIHSSIVLKPKLILKERYQIMKVIGRGMSGQVYQAKDILADRFVAIKQIYEKAIQYDFFRQISHQNIIRYYNNFLQSGKRYLVLQYFPMTLKDLLKDSKNQTSLSEQDVRHIFKSIINGLSYLHSLSIAHRDIKLDNIVISVDLKQVKFIDFGLCIDLSKVQQGLSKQFCGTLSYLSPQIAQGQPHEPKKADIWSLGIVLYSISVGRLPFKGRNENQILSKICKGKPIYPQGFNPKLKQLIQNMIQKNPVKRWTVNEILSHQWLH